VAEAADTSRVPALHDSREVIEYIRRTADTIHDPCGMATGVRLGLNEMGLLRRVETEPDADGWSVRVQLRLTSPGCLYFFAFKDNLEERLTAAWSWTGTRRSTGRRRTCPRRQGVSSRSGGARCGGRMEGDDKEVAAPCPETGRILRRGAR
jgi:hypothetical protein